METSNQPKCCSSLECFICGGLDKRFTHTRGDTSPDPGLPHLNTFSIHFTHKLSGQLCFVWNITSSAVTLCHNHYTHRQKLILYRQELWFCIFAFLEAELGFLVQTSEIIFVFPSHVLLIGYYQYYLTQWWPRICSIWTWPPINIFGCDNLLLTFPVNAKGVVKYSESPCVLHNKVTGM